MLSSDLKSTTNSAGSKRLFDSLWFGLPKQAKDSRVFAAAGLLLTMIVLTVCYFKVNALADARGVTVFDPAQLFVVGGRSLDSRIPYLPWTIVIYGCNLVFYLLPVLTYPKTASGARELFELYSGLIMITLVACVVFILCPAEMTLRVAADHQGGSMLLHENNLALHAVDPSFNTWPCLHVAQPGLIILVVTRWLGQRHWTVFLWIGWTALAISTLTTKQHFIWDIITGSVLALAYWHWKLRKPAIGDHEP